MDENKISWLGTIESFLKPEFVVLIRHCATISDMRKDIKKVQMLEKFIDELKFESTSDVLLIFTYLISKIYQQYQDKFDKLRIKGLTMNPVGKN